jgi:replication factor C subunit 1
MVRLRAAALTYEDVKGKLGTSKDADMSPFECARRLLDGSSSRSNIGERLEMVFQDADLVPLLIQENYINHRPDLAQGNDAHVRVEEGRWL